MAIIRRVNLQDILYCVSLGFFLPTACFSCRQCQTTPPSCACAHVVANSLGLNGSETGGGAGVHGAISERTNTDLS